MNYWLVYRGYVLNTTRMGNIGWAGTWKCWV